MAEVVRTPIGPDAHLPTRRTLDERLIVLEDDVQLSLYQIGAKESWKLDASRQSYYYVLDNQQVPLEPTRAAIERVRETALEVAEGIRLQHFERSPRSRPAAPATSSSSARRLKGNRL
jgi:hypothetical protein